MRKLFFSLVLLLASSSLLAYKITFDNSIAYSNGVPEGWEKVGSGSIAMMEPSLIGGELGLGFNFAPVKASTNIIRTVDAVIPSKQIVCDCILARLRVYIQSTAYTRSDFFQVVVSTNDWQTYEKVGEPVFLQENGRSVAEWVTVERSQVIPGLRNSQNDISVGILAGAAGYTTKRGYLQSLEMGFVATATPKDVQFGVGEEIVLSFVPGETNAFVVARVDAYPLVGEGAVSITNVYCNLVRGDETNVLAMTFDATTGYYRSAMIFPAIDAGESLSATVYAVYNSTLEKLGEKISDEENASAREQALPITAECAQLGSVWINEFSLEEVEICGSPNRNILAGWSIELVSTNGTYKADLTGILDFTNKDNMINGVVGIATREIRHEWTKDGYPIEISSIPLGEYTLRLLNSAGVDEHQGNLRVVLPIMNSYGMTGYSKFYGYDYNWTGMASLGAWGALSESTPGSVNCNQGFKVPISGTIVINTEKIGGEPLSYAVLKAEAKGVQNDSDMNTVSDFYSQSEDGIAIINITNVFSATPTQVPMTVQSEAFGWYADATNIVLQSGTEVQVTSIFQPSIALDKFDAIDMRGYWVNQEPLQWAISNDGENGILQVDTRTTRNKLAILKCVNSLSLRGKRLALVTFDYRNWASRETPSRDNFCVQITTNSTWDSSEEIISTPLLTNKNSAYGNQEWYNFSALLRLPENYSGVDDVFVRLRCDTTGLTASYSAIDNLRIAFQDMATVEGLKWDGSKEEPSFEIDVKPWCGEGQSVSNVTAQLVMDVNGKVFTNEVAAVNLAEDTPFTISNEIIRANLRANVGYEQLRAYDKVKYWAQVKYFADSRDPDPAKEWETKFYPDNSKVDSEGRWTVEGEYGVDMAKVESENTFIVPGDAITLNGKGIEQTAEGADFSFRVYDASGVGVSNVTVTVTADGKEPKVFEFTADEAGIVRFDGNVELRDLVENTEYTITINGTNYNGETIATESFSDSFITWPKPPDAAITSDSKNSATLTVSGSSGRYEVSEGWESNGDGTTWTWTKSVLTPNCEVTATVRAINDSGESAPLTVKGYTLAAAATSAPAYEEGMTSATIYVGDDYDAEDDGNPDNTLYAVRVTTETDKTGIIATNGTEEVWQTLADWRNNRLTVSEPTIDLTVTNYFSFVTRNGDGVKSESTVKADCWFDMKAEFDGVLQQIKGGKVKFSLKLFDPANAQSATAEVEYKIGDNEWVSCGDELAVEFNERNASIKDIEWDAWTAAGRASGYYNYKLRVRVNSGNRSSEWAETSGELDFVAPEGLTLNGTPANGAVTKEAKVELTASATDEAGIVYRWTFNDAEDAEETEGAFNATANEGGNTISVYAEDIFGNKSEPVTRSWMVDTIKPEIVKFEGTRTADEKTNDTSFSFTVEATDKNTVSYIWKLNDVVQLATGTTFTGEVSADGDYVVSVVAVDAANNQSEERTLSWELDTTKPEIVKFEGNRTAGETTNDKEFSFTVEATDKNTVSYIWKLNDVVQSATGTTFAGEVSADGDYTVTVVAVDAAKNQSEERTLSWELDTTKPVITKFEGTRTAGEKTNDKSFSFTVEATDKNTVSYIWKLNDVVQSATGTTFTGEVSADGDYVVSVVAVDAVKNESEGRTLSWELDTTKPEIVKFEGTRTAEEKTNEKVFSFTVEATDKNTVSYIWRLNDEVQSATGATFEGEVSADGDYTVTVVAVDAAKNESEARSISWELDTTKPEITKFEGNRTDGEKTNVKEFSFTVEATDKNTVSYIWKLNGAVQAETGATFAGEVSTDGDYTVTVVAVDAAKNQSEARSVSWELDTTKPEIVKFEGTRTAGEKTNVKEFSFTVEATDKNTVSYIWKLNGAVQAETGATFAGEVLTDGDYTVTVVAVDAAKNESEARSVSWELDTTKPEIVKFEGTRTAGEKTNEKAFSFMVEATDKNTVSYIWKLNDVVQSATGTTFTGEVSADGDYTVMVVAVDAANNHSEERSLSWTLDTTKPEIVKFEGNRTDGEKTNDKEFSFTVEATDENTVSYIWKLNDAVQSATGTTFTGEVSADGDYTVTVVAVDAAKNKSEERSLSWELDTTKPEIVKFEGNRTVGEKTNEKSFSFTVEATDKNTVSYIWKLNDAVQSATGTTFTGEVSADGDYAVTVVAVDAAKNQSEARSISWELDTTNPEITKFEGTRTEGEKTNDKSFSFTVEATDKNTVSYIWTLNGAVQTVTGATFAGEVAADGDYTVSVVAVDAAKNKSEARSISWELDTTKPEIVKFEGNPMAGEKTNKKLFGFTVEATDKNTVSYVWKLNDVVQSETGTTFTGEVSTDGDYTVTVVAVDAAKNESEGRTLSWELDTTKPEIVKFEGTRKAGEKTNDKSFSFTVEATDKNTVSYIWKLNDVVQSETGATFTGEVSEDGDYTVTVVAVDAAENESESRFVGWEYDSTKPTVELTCGNEIGEGGKFLCSKLKPMIVTAKFSENVDGFAIEDVSTVNGIVSDLSGSGDTYTFKVTPEKADEVRVNIAAGVAVDDAKNENTQSNELVGEFTDDVKPAISLMSDAPERINAAYGSIKVEIRFSEHINGFDTGDIVAGSANVELEVLDENENTYIATITPTKDETMSVVIPAGAVTDDAGNENTESNILTYECDITAPKVELTSSTPEYFNEARNPFAVTVTFSEPVEGFTKDQVIVENGSVANVKTLVEDKEFELSITPNADGEVRVTSADGIVDKFENGVEASSSVARIRDTVKPTQPTITLDKGSSKFLAFASSQDASPVKYYWIVNNSNFTGSPIYIISKTNNKVTCRCEDAAGNKSDDATQSWSTSASTSKGTDFGDDVWMPRSGDYNVPDKVTFTASDIKPGSDSKFTFSGVYSVKEDLTALNMYLIVSETLTGPTWNVPVNESATYNLETGELTVTLPSKEMRDKEGNAYQSFFIRGISNTKR